MLLRKDLHAYDYQDHDKRVCKGIAKDLKKGANSNSGLFSKGLINKTEQPEEVEMIRFPPYLAEPPYVVGRGPADLMGKRLSGFPGL